MIKNRKRKAFTIIELVIVIAVIAILAGVLIPTFAGIIARANESADIQAVRQMNMALLAESVENKPEEIANVIDIVAEKGYDSAEKRTPASSNHGFFWHSGTNLIILVKNSTELIFPEDNAELNEIFEADGFDISANSNFYNLKDHDGTGESGIKTAEDLKAALTAGGEYSLGADITIETADQAITIPVGTTASLDLNGYTLTLPGPADGDAFENIIIHGALTIQDSRGSGKIIITDSTVAANGGLGGIFVEGGTLNLKNVKVEGNREWNIYSKSGTLIEFTDVVYTIHGGFGLYTDCTTNITGGSFIAAGEDVTPLHNFGGNVTIDRTTFSENGAVSYGNNAAIYSSGGTLTLENVTVGTLSDEACSVFTSGACDVSITGGTFKNELLLGGTGEIIIYSGEFEKLVTCCSTVTIHNGTFKDGYKLYQGDTTTINGGTFTGTVTVYGGGSYTPEIIIEGGSFTDLYAMCNNAQIIVNGGTVSGKLLFNTHDTYYPVIKIKEGHTNYDKFSVINTDTVGLYTNEDGTEGNINNLKATEKIEDGVTYLVIEKA